MTIQELLNISKCSQYQIDRANTINYPGKLGMFKNSRPVRPQAARRTRRTGMYVEFSEATRTPLADFFNFPIIHALIHH